MATEAQRIHLLALMKYLLAHEPQIHYAQIRPMRTVRLSEAQLHTLLHAGHSITMDCSEAVTCLCKWAGLRDPNGLHYDGSGYTGTMLAHLSHYSDPAKAHVGALVVFGPPPGDHVCMVMRRGSDPMLWSHGSEGGPRRVPFSVERAVHRKPATFLSISPL
jgi:hypothetical protein